MWMDGLGGQKDELEDVQKDRLTPLTDDEGAGSLDERNGPVTETADALETDSLEDLERRAGLKPL